VPGYVVIGLPALIYGISSWATDPAPYLSPPLVDVGASMLIAATLDKFLPITAHKQDHSST